MKTPDMVTAGSHKKVWWQCHAGHVWQATVYSRTHGGNQVNEDMQARIMEAFYSR